MSGYVALEFRKDGFSVAGMAARRIDLLFI